MVEAIIIISAIILGALSTLLCNKVNKDGTIRVFKKTYTYPIRKWIEYAFSVLLFLSFSIVLFGTDWMTNQWTLSNPDYSEATIVYILIIRWLIHLNVVLCVVGPFFDIKWVKNYLTFVSPVITIMAMASFTLVFKTFTGSMEFTYKYALYVISFLAMGGINALNIYDYIKAKNFNIKETLKGIGMAMLCAFPFLASIFPVWGGQLIFGPTDKSPDDFNVWHRCIIYFVIVLAITVYLSMKDQSYAIKRFTIISLAFAGFIQFYCVNMDRVGWNSLPLHLCYVAITLMFIAFVFNIKSLMYFMYLVNVMGAFVAIMLPSDVDNGLTAMHFSYWFSHIYDILLPILAVSWGVIKRPNFKLVLHAISAAVVYWAAMCIVNGLINNSPAINPAGDTTDYFFVYKNHIVNSANFLIPIKENFVWYIDFGNGWAIKFYWLYQILFVIVFIGLIFAMWGFYGCMYKIEDAHMELARRRKLMQVDELNFLKELDGRPRTEPLNKEGVHMIKISNFTKVYSGAKKKSVDDLSLEVHEGEVFGFVGHNGAGKSTTIKSMVGIQSITQGKIEIMGYDISQQPLEAKLQIGYVSDNHAVYEKLTGREYISYVASLYMVDPKDRDERLEKYAKMFSIDFALDNEIKSYSHGMKQKIMVIGSLIHNPKVWVLDEPLTGLDPTSAYQIKKCMREHADAGNIVFFSSHVIEVVEKICDRIAIIADGKLREVATIKEIQERNESLEDLYLKYVDKSLIEQNKIAQEENKVKE